MAVSRCPESWRIVSSAAPRGPGLPPGAGQGRMVPTKPRRRARLAVLQTPVTVTAHTPALRGLANTLLQVRRSERQRINGLFRVLGARLAVTRRIDSELDRLLATRFSPLDYLRTDELGLSRIVADLLNPSAGHGQGTVFLSRFLEKIAHALPDGLLRSPHLASAKTVCERGIDGGGRLDISVEIGAIGPEPLCIAIENKPYAADGDGQIDAYLKFLRSRYPGRFLLIYLSPHGGLPSPESLPRDAPTDGLRTLSYCPQSHGTGNADAALQFPFALTDWLRECALTCDIDRLRWFLRDTENFCHKTFGGVLTTSRELREVRDFILQSEDNLLAALAVLDAFPTTMNEVVAGFLERLHQRIVENLDREGLAAGHYFGNNPNQDGVWAYRSSWEGESSRPYVWLGHDNRGRSAKWWLGVRFDPFSESDPDPRIESLRKPLADHLGPPSAPAKSFPWFRWLEDPDWAPLLVQMHEERQDPGPLTELLASQFISVAHEAVRLIDESTPGVTHRRDDSCFVYRHIIVVRQQPLATVSLAPGSAA